MMNALFFLSFKLHQQGNNIINCIDVFHFSICWFFFFIFFLSLFPFHHLNKPLPLLHNKQTQQHTTQNTQSEQGWRISSFIILHLKRRVRGGFRVFNSRGSWLGSSSSRDSMLLIIVIIKRNSNTGNLGHVLKNHQKHLHYKKNISSSFPQQGKEQTKKKTRNKRETIGRVSNGHKNQTRKRTKSRSRELNFLHFNAPLAEFATRVSFWAKAAFLCRMWCEILQEWHRKWFRLESSTNWWQTDPHVL